MPYLRDVFGPWRDRSRDHETLTHYYREYRQRANKRCNTTNGRPVGAPRFWQIPPSLRGEAEAYERALCEKWAARIRRVPDFRRILHMITINQFRNPGQSREAYRKGLSAIGRRGGVRRKLSREVFGAPEVAPASVAVPVSIRYLPLE